MRQLIFVGLAAVHRGACLRAPSRFLQNTVDEGLARGIARTRRDTVSEVFTVNLAAAPDEKGEIFYRLAVSAGLEFKTYEGSGSIQEHPSIADLETCVSGNFKDAEGNWQRENFLHAAKQQETTGLGCYRFLNPKLVLGDDWSVRLSVVCQGGAITLVFEDQKAAAILNVKGLKSHGVVKMDSTPVVGGEFVPPTHTMKDYDVLLKVNYEKTCSTVDRHHPFEALVKLPDAHHPFVIHT